MAPFRWRVLLLCHSGLDARARERLIVADRDVEYDVTSCLAVEDALAHLESAEVDIVLVDLGGEESGTPAVLAHLRQRHGDVPMVGLLGTESDGALLARCLEAGAADVGVRESLTVRYLQRLLAGAIGRSQAGTLVALQRSLGAHQLLAAEIVDGWVGVAKRWHPLLRKVHPAKLQEIDVAYERVLRETIQAAVARKRIPRASARHLAMLLLRLGARSADVLDVHATAMAAVVQKANEAERKAAMQAGRPLVIECIARLHELGTGASLRRSSRTNLKAAVVDTARRRSSRSQLVTPAALADARRSSARSSARTSGLEQSRRTSAPPSRRASDRKGARRNSDKSAETDDGGLSLRKLVSRVTGRISSRDTRRRSSQNKAADTDNVERSGDSATHYVDLDSSGRRR